MLLNRRSEEAQRSSEDRRENSCGNLESEQRSETDPRRSVERRVLCYAVLLKTGIPYADFGAWLGANIYDKWVFVLKIMDGGLTSKTLRMMFETEEDKERCMASADRILG